ncbi:hypothetical protein TNCV_857381 [Trichonephila clavipes]|nr:hypothetical protein TNCV_857381 [Trichonephila clavipes]
MKSDGAELSLSATYDQMFQMRERSGKVLIRAPVEHLLYRSTSGYDRRVQGVLALPSRKGTSPKNRR